MIIIIKDHMNNTCQLIDMTIPSDRNVSIKEVEKLSKYKDLEIEVSKMWKMKTTTLPLVIGALGVIKKGMRWTVAKIPGTINIEELQKIALMGTAHILRKVLSIDLWDPVYPKTYGLDLDLQEDNPRIKRHIAIVIIIIVVKNNK